MTTRSILPNSLTGILTIILIAVFFSCQDEEDNPLGLPLKDDGFFIINEGAFGNSDTSLSFYSSESGEVTNNIFQLVNNRPLGDQSQSMTIHSGDRLEKTSDWDTAHPPQDRSADEENTA